MTAITLGARRTHLAVDRRIAIVYVVLAVAALPVWPFAVHLALHILGAGMLIGNAIVMAIWLSVAGFAGSDLAKRRAARAVVVGDLLFTIPGAVLLLTKGLAMVFERYRGTAAFTSVPFIGAGLVLLSATGIVWAAGLVPAQRTLGRLAGADGPLDGVAFRSTLIRWSVWGTVATVLPIVAVVVMTSKPVL